MSAPMHTMNDVFDRYLLDHVPTLGAITQRDYKRHILVLREHFGDRVPGEIKPRDVGRFLDVKAGLQHRNKIVAVLSGVMTLAVGRWFVDGCDVNPCSAVERHPSFHRTRYITDAEFNAVRDLGPFCVQLAMDLALITGQLLELLTASLEASSPLTAEHGQLISCVDNRNPFNFLKGFIMIDLRPPRPKQTRVGTAADWLLDRCIPVPESGCWIWLMSVIQDGYGRMQLGPRKVLAHRFSYETFVGPIPDGMLVLHSCDVPPCINPNHLFLGDDAANSADKVAKQRQARGPTHGLRGNDCPASKLKEDDIRAIRADSRSGDLIASDYGICSSNVYFIKARKTWRHVA